MGKVNISESDIKWFFGNASVIFLSVFVFVITLILLAVGFSILLGIGGSVNTDVFLWPLWLTLIVLMWSLFAAAGSWLLDNIADDLSVYYNISDSVCKFCTFLVKTTSLILYPALLFWVGVFRGLRFLARRAGA